MTNNFYITTPIYYLNDKPHIGHAYTSVASDAIARYWRLQDANVKFLTGTDEHGQKVEKSAKKQEIEPQKFVDDLCEKFKDLTNLLNLSNDDFIRTTQERHKKAVQKLWQILEENGHIYLDKYAGWYSVRDEAFYAESELVDGKAPTGAEVEWVEEESYFFNLSQWQEALLKHYEEHQDFIWPKSRYNEVVNFVKNGLNDLSISRTSFNWGVKVPGNDKHIIYVWLDALTNYLSAIGFGSENESQMSQFWPANQHVIGKDITRFHAIYWPAFLMAANLPLPKQILTHGWWTNEGEKISKSLGNIIDPHELVEEFGQEQTRYFLMRGVNFGNDGNFSKNQMIELINSELANNIGNLVQRTMSMIFKNCEEKLPNFDLTKYGHNEHLKKISEFDKQFHHHFQENQFSNAIDIIINFANYLNQLIEESAPWHLKKTDPQKMHEILYVLAESIRNLAIMLQPFMPILASKILQQIGSEASENVSFEQMKAEFALKPETPISKPSGLIPRIETKE